MQGSSLIQDVKTQTRITDTSTVSLLGILICALGAIFYSYEYLLRISPSVMAPDLMKHYSMNAALFGTVSGMYYYAYVPMQLPVGMLMDKFGPRRLLTVACLICVGGTYLFSSTNSVFLCALGRLLVGFGSSFAFVGVLKLGTIWLSPNRFAMFAGLSAALGTVGALCGDIVLTHLVNRLGWIQTNFYAAFAGIILAVVLFAVIRDKNPARPVSAPDAMGTPLRGLKIIMSNPQIWVVGLVGCFIYLPTTVFAELWGIPYLEHARAMSPETAAYGVSCLFLGFTIGAPLLGWVSDKLQTRRKVLSAAAVVSSIFAVLLIYAPNLSVNQVYAVLFFLGITYSGQALVFAIARELSPPAAAGTAVAVTNMLVMLGGMVAQPLAGVILDAVWKGTIVGNLHVYTASDYRTAFSMLPVGIFISAILILFVKETFGTQYTEKK